MDVAWFPLVITVYGIAGIVCAIAAYFIAMHKHRDRETWAFVSFFVPPLLLILMALKPIRLVYAQPLPHVHDDDEDGDDGDGQARNMSTRYNT